MYCLGWSLVYGLGALVQIFVPAVGQSLMCVTVSRFEMFT